MNLQTIGRQAERHLVAEHAVAHILNQSAEILHAASQILEAICESLDWDVGALWIVDRQAQVLRCVDVWHVPTVEVPIFEQVCRQNTFSRGIGLPGRIWASESHAWIPDVTCDANFPRANIAAQEGLHAACGFPIQNGVDFLGVMEFFSRDIRQPDQELLDMMLSIGRDISQFLERRRAEQTVRDRELEFALARQIQQGLLPKAMPVMPGFAFGGASRFAQETGGDYYDFFPLLDGGLCIAIGDASGHGISAALVMEETRASLRALALTGADAGAIVALTNRCLVTDLPMGQFVTLFLARLDPGTRSLVYCNAGHPSGYVLDQHGEVRLVLQSTDIPLGLDSTAEFPAAPATTLLPGDLVLLFTDGVTETFSPGDSLFGIGRMLDVVRAHRRKSPTEIVQALFSAVADFSGNHAQLDDITAVIIKVEASNSLSLAPHLSA